MAGIDRVIHEPVRLRILMVLSGVDRTDFKFLVTTLGLSKGNLSSHIDRLERTGHVKVNKSFNGKIPHTSYRLTRKGRQALENYWSAMDEIRSAAGKR